MRLLAYALLLAAFSGCSDPLAAQSSPDGRFTLKPSLYEGALVRVTVKDQNTGKQVDDFRSRDTDAMKWVSGWVDNTSYLFWGSDTGTFVVRHLEGTTVTESPIEGPACTRLEQLYAKKYDEHVGNCLKR